MNRTAKIAKIRGEAPPRAGIVTTAVAPNASEAIRAVRIVAPNRRAVSKRAAQIKEPTIENSMLLFIPGADEEIGPTSVGEKWSGCVGIPHRVVQQIAHQRIGAWKCARQRDTIHPARMGFF
jgi:hypothetical protein